MATPLSMVFDILAIDRASAVFARVGESATLAGDASEKGMGRVATAGVALAKGFTLAGVAVAVLSTKMAADFQTATNQLVTSAGETEANLGLVRKGLLDMAGQVGVSATELAKGMYQVESAGFHGAAGLDVMRAAAEGAKAEGANMETVANALTTTLNNYGKELQGNAVKGTDFLVASVSLGKTRMEDFASSISNVLPVAKSVGLGLGEVGGAMATMTSEGISSDQAATYLRQTIVKLADQTPKAKNEMKALGLESINVAGHLGKVGLAGTLQELTDAIGKHLGPQGLVMLDSLKKAGQNADQFQAALTNLPPAAQTYIGALTTMVGGQKTMMGALALTGDHMATFVDDTAKINAAMDGSGAHVKGWEIVQGSFNQKVDQLKAGAGALAIDLGTKLLPALTTAFGWLSTTGLPAIEKFGAAIDNVFGYISAHSAVFGTIGSAVLGAAAAFAVWKTVTEAWSLATKIGTVIQAAFTVVMNANPIMLTVMAIAALAAAAIYAYKHFKGFHDVVDAVFRFFKTLPKTVSDVAGAIGRWFERMWHDVAGFVERMWHDVTGFVERMWHDVTGFFSRIWNDVSGFASRIWNDVTGWFSRMWNDIKGIVTAIVTVIREHWRLILTVATAGVGLIYILIQDHWKQISGLFMRLWNDVTGFVSRIWHDVSGFFANLSRDVINIVTGIWTSVSNFFSRIWNDVSGFASRIWHDVSGFFTNLANDVAGIVSGIWNNEVRFWTRIWDSVSGLARRLWNDVSGFFMNLLTDIGGIISRIYDHLATVWGNIFTKVTGVASDIWHGVTTFFGNMRDDVVGVFKDVVTKVGSIWDGIKDLISKPVKWVVDVVYNNGILKLLHGIGGVLHEDTLSHLPEIPAFARGGIVPGTHNRDDVPIYATPGEVMVPKSVVASFGGAQALMSMLGFGGGGGAGGHYSFGGGVLSNIGHGIGSAASAVGHGVADLAGDALSGLANLTRGAMGSVAGPIVNNLLKLADGALSGMGGMGDIMKKIAHHVGEMILNFIKGDDTANVGNYGGPAGAPGGGVERWRNVVVAMLARHGLGAEFANGVLSLINSESGGNPDAINLTDSNAMAGHPSRGLMQTIPTTFEAYRAMDLPDNIVDPDANLYAGIGYALKNYGAGMLMAGGRHSAGGGYVGYDTGGIMAHRGIGQNLSGSPERVLSPAQTDSFERLVALLERGGMSSGSGSLINSVTIRETVDADVVMQRLEFLSRAGRVV